MIGIFEYCGPQRCGKSTLMVCDYLTKVLPDHDPKLTFANFHLDIDGVQPLPNDRLLSKILELKAAKVRDVVIMFDEVGQELKARSYTDKTQTEVVNFAWQMPKRGWCFMYCSNIGNSADIILRDATWITILPRYIHGETRADDFILADVIFNYDCRVRRGIRVTGFQLAQDLFDSWQPIE